MIVDHNLSPKVLSNILLGHSVLTMGVHSHMNTVQTFYEISIICGSGQYSFYCIMYNTLRSISC